MYSWNAAEGKRGPVGEGLQTGDQGFDAGACVL